MCILGEGCSSLVTRTYHTWISSYGCAGRGTLQKLKWLVGIVWFCLIHVSWQGLFVKVVLVVFVLSSSSNVDYFILPIQKIILKERYPVHFAFRELVLPRIKRTKKLLTARKMETAEISNIFARNERQMFTIIRIIN
jgi:hypothetical protein